MLDRTGHIRAEYGEETQAAGKDLARGAHLHQRKKLLIECKCEFSGWVPGEQRSPVSLHSRLGGSAESTFCNRS